MLHSQLSQYLRDVENALEELKGAYIEHYSEEVLTPDRFNLRIRVRFVSGHLLELHEAVIINNGYVTHLSYRYHFQDKHNKLVFRYDNAPHFPKLDNFPHHKHLPNRVDSTNNVSIIKAIKEASNIAEGRLNPEI